ncbi:HAD family hydrolase [Xanthobacter autotrophicus]|uniref:HAD family hydrolase n=1 Tax=Xanthobacter autotrophicus TaxID=280 RepID=UPI0024A6993A|nr:HAD family hydrolase [Xanthobacter autotrophicus]MDI4655783.1 HAD family hydrolase [Xanthobacter autotrophicus]
MRDVSALLFDKDGTLVDFDRTWGPACGAAMRALAGDDAAALARLQTVSHYLPAEGRFLHTSPLVSGSSAHYGPLWAQALGRPATPDFLAEIDDLFAREGLAFLTPIGRPQATLAHLGSAGFVLGIVTNDAEDSARRQAEALGILPLLAAVHGYDSGFGSKPGPGMVAAFGTRFGLAPHTMAVIGDSAHDLAAARGAGARFIAVRSGPAPIDDLLSEADLVVDSIDDLPRLLERERSSPERENAV